MKRRLLATLLSGVVPPVTQPREQRQSSSTKKTARQLGDPSITLVRNDDVFGLLVAEGAHEDSTRTMLILDDVFYLQVWGKDWSYQDFESVALFCRDGIWYARDFETGRYFPNPSERPYETVFITPNDFICLQNWRVEGLAFPVFQAASRHFAQLPGFKTEKRWFRPPTLTAPDGYAEAVNAVSKTEYVEMEAGAV